MKTPLPVALIGIVIAVHSLSALGEETGDKGELADPTGIAKLVAKQLDAYNRADLDEFCSCYHPNVRVFDGNKEKPSGIKAFRERYEKMFSEGGFSATVSKRVVHGDHCVDLEHWQRKNGKRGTVLVRYTRKDGLIGVVQFLR